MLSFYEIEMIRNIEGDELNPSFLHIFWSFQNQENCFKIFNFPSLIEFWYTYLNLYSVCLMTNKHLAVPATNQKTPNFPAKLKSIVLHSSNNTCISNPKIAKSLHRKPEFSLNHCLWREPNNHDRKRSQLCLGSSTMDCLASISTDASSSTCAYSLLLHSLSIIPIWHYLIAFLIGYVFFIYNFLEFHFVEDLLTGFRGSPVKITYGHCSEIYDGVVSKCKILHGRYLLSCFCI